MTCILRRRRSSSFPQTLVVIAVLAAISSCILCPFNRSPAVPTVLAESPSPRPASNRKLSTKRVFRWLEKRQSQTSSSISIAGKEKEEEGQEEKDNPQNSNMGQAVRMMSYDRAANERNAISALNLLQQQLSWYRLDDGVMGGQSETNHRSSSSPASSNNNNTLLHFEGTINTNGGGFCSIRAKLPPSGLPPSTTGIRLRLVGDGKTYKFLLSDGTRNTFGPSKRSPSWQADIPTTRTTTANSGNIEQEVIIPFDTLVPSWGPFTPSQEEQDKVRFDAQSMKEIGLMLSLRLSDGSPNPASTFGQGIFPFALQIRSIEPVVSSNNEEEK